MLAYCRINLLNFINPPLAQKCVQTLGVFTSRLLNCYYQVMNPEKGEAFAQVKVAHLRRLPIRSIDPTNPTDLAQHDCLVALVQQMLDLHQRIAAKGNLQVKTMLQRQIDATDSQIDPLAYGLYGLTAEEVGVMEGA